MSRDVRLSHEDHGYVLPDVIPSSRVRMRMLVASRTSGMEHTHPATTTSDGDVDNLGEARGIVHSALLGGGLWVLIGLIVWLIAR